MCAGTVLSKCLCIANAVVGGIIFIGFRTISTYLVGVRLTRVVVTYRASVRQIVHVKATLRVLSDFRLVVQ